MTTSDVTVHVATWNARHATELCVRSLHRYAGYPFDLVVGYSASGHGYEEMLRRLERRGAFRLEVAETHRHHADWLDAWLAACDRKWCAFVDCDVEFLRPAWLRDLVRTATEHKAAVVCGAFEPERPGYVQPDTGRVMRIAARPSPYVILLDTNHVREIGVSFRQVIEEHAAVPEGRISYDTGAMFFREVERQGLRHVEMPHTYRSSFVHYGSISWGTTLPRWSPLWLEVMRKRLVIRTRLLGYQLRQPGWRPEPAASSMADEA